MSYSEMLIIILPVALAGIAASIGRALDPDTGGADSFRREITGYTGEGMDMQPIYGDTIKCVTPCSPEFKAGALAMIADKTGAMLHAVVVADYKARWPDLQCPTLDDCAAFVQGVLSDPVGQ
jgi:hypothetical protein